MSTRKYANAKDVLPDELLKELQKYHCGFLYVPSTNEFYGNREKLVIELKRSGVGSREVAALAGITIRRVNQIYKNSLKSEV